MTDPDLEQLLRALPLRPPTVALDHRVAAAVRRAPWHPARWAAAAAVLVAGGIALKPASHARPKPRPQVALSPVSVEREVSRTIDDGVIAVNGRVPYRQLRHQTVREVWWADPSTGARLWARLPDERVTVEPAETF